MLRTAACYVSGLALSFLVQWGAEADAADTGITGKKLLLISPSKIVLLSRDLAITTMGSDPMGGGRFFRQFQ